MWLATILRRCFLVLCRPQVAKILVKAITLDVESSHHREREQKDLDRSVMSRSPSVFGSEMQIFFVKTGP
jgi:hypothetical protein